MDSDLALPQFGSGSDGGSASLSEMPPPPDRDAIIALGPRGAIERYRAGIGVFSRELLMLDDGQLDTVFLPEAGVGRWSIRMVMGHLADAELVNSMRFRRTVAEDGVVLPSWDFESFLDAGLYDGPGSVGEADGKPAGRSGQPIAAYLALIHAIRTATTEWLDLLPEVAWSRRALHAERGPMSLLDLVGGCAWHLEHHAWFVEAKARRLTGRTVLATRGAMP